MRRSPAIVAVGFVVFFMTAAASAAPIYRLTDLGGTGFDLTADGRILGTVGSVRSIWTPDAPAGPTGSWQAMTFTGAADSRMPAGMNGVGNVAGTLFFGAVSGDRAFLWRPSTPNGASGTTITLPLPSEFTSSLGNDINASGQVAGRIFDGLTSHAFLWSPTVVNGSAGAIVDLGDLPGGADGSVGYFVNAHGQVAGYSHTAAGQRAFLWTPTTANAATGSMIGLPTLGGNYGDVAGLNDHGQVIGLTLNAATDNEGFLWTPDADNGITGNIAALPIRPTSLNNVGQICGGLLTPGQGAAMIWTAGNGAVRLDTLVDPSTMADWTLDSAPRAINDVGQIIGVASFGPFGQQRGYLLTPIPEPSALLAPLLTSAALLNVRQRRKREGR